MAKKSVTMQELIGRKEELNKTSQLLSEKFHSDAENNTKVELSYALATHSSPSIEYS